MRFAAPMLTYEYKCDACGHELIKEQRITEKPIKKCPNCGKLKLRRMVGTGNFILKGGGWESDLYSGASNRAKDDSKSSDSSESSASDSSSESKTESKPKKKKKATKKKAKKKAKAD